MAQSRRKDLHGSVFVVVLVVVIGAMIWFFGSHTPHHGGPAQPAHSAPAAGAAH